MELMLRAKKNVVCEKPICMNSSQLDRVLNLARENNVFLMEVGKLEIHYCVFYIYIRIHEKLLEAINVSIISDVVKTYTVANNVHGCCCIPDAS
jgi:hypothetical protein